MQQVATFDVSEQQECNEFLKTVKPGNLTVSNGRIVIFYDDGTYPAAYQIVDLCEHLDSVRKARFQQEIALHVIKAELAETETNYPKYDELTKAVKELPKAIATQDVKEAYLLKRIEELQH